jgi:DNA-binding NarL/FixJ family response regulator
LSVLRLIARGKSAGAIAAQLSLSVSTVTTYRSRLLKKLDMKTNAELVRFALENRIIM